MMDLFEQEALQLSMASLVANLDVQAILLELKIQNVLHNRECNRIQVLNACCFISTINDKHYLEEIQQETKD